MNYKGFDKDMKCRGFQYEVGKEYEESVDVQICKKGFHACEDPIDVFNYYPPSDSRFCEVEQYGEIRKDKNDSKVASSRIKIGGEIGLKGIIEAGVKFRMERCTYEGDSVTTGYQAGAQATGNRAGAQATGDQAGAQATGNRAGAQATGYQAGAQATGVCAVSTAIGPYGTAVADGKHAIACALGYKCKAKGSIGTTLVLAEREDWNGECYPLLGIEAVRVDGKKIKENVWYALRGDRVVEV